MRRVTDEEAKKLVGGWGCYCSICVWARYGSNSYVMGEAISHAGLGHVVHCCVTSSAFINNGGESNPNLVWY